MAGDTVTFADINMGTRDGPDLSRAVTPEEGHEPALEDKTTKSMAANATHAEAKMGLLEGIRLYPKAAFWSILLSTTIVMEGFDNVLTGQFYALPQFKRRFGALQPDGSYEVPAAWQAGLSNGVLLGSLLGILAAGWAADRWGYRRVMMAELCITIGTIFIYFFAQNIQTLMVAAVLMGFPFGGYETLTTSYAADVMPVALRSYATSYVNLCWVIGQMIASGAVRGCMTLQGDLAFRIPYALQWLWPVPILVGLFFAPESPWWLVREDRVDAARRSLVRLTSRSQSSTFDPDETIAMMKRTIRKEKADHAGITYWDCFRGHNLRRTELACFVWASQGLCGSAIFGYSAYLYQQIGLSNEHAYTMTLVQYALGFLGTLASWSVMAVLGRRTLYLFGLLFALAILVGVGTSGLITGGVPNASAGWATAGMLLVYTLVYNLAIGSICYSLVSELPAVRLRIKTVGLARGAYNLVNLFNYSVTPYMLNPTAWNWGARAGWFFAGLTALCATWVFCRLPEPKGLTYGELDELFHTGTPARQFKRLRDQARARGTEIHLVETAAVGQPQKRPEDGEPAKASPKPDSRDSAAP